MRKNGRQRGFTLIEVAIVLGLVLIAIPFAAYKAKDYADSLVNRATADYQARFSDAVVNYVKDNNAAVKSVATSTTPAVITSTMLKNTGYLLAGFSDLNPYGQTVTARILQPVAGKLDTVVVSTGGTTIDERNLRHIAEAMGTLGSGGYISTLDPANAVGVFGKWGKIAIAAYGVSPGAGHLVNLLSFQNETLVSDYLYRNSVVGQPQLNQMNTPLIMASVQTIGASCSAVAAIAQDGSGMVISCQNGSWQPQGSAYWKDPVATYASLPACTSSSVGQTRIVQYPSAGSGARAYSCNGWVWSALAIDDWGNLVISGTATLATLAGNLQLDASTIVNVGDPCPRGADDNGRLARDISGQTLSCQSGYWARQGATRVSRVAKVTLIDQGVSNGKSMGWHDLCYTTGTYQNGENGWISLVSSDIDASSGKRFWSAYSSCAPQGCDAGTLSINVECVDFN